VKFKNINSDTVIRFKNWDCLLTVLKYGNGRPALVLNDAEDGSQIAVASVNVPDLDLGDDEIVIKDYSENEGMLDALVEAGVIQDTGLRVASGYVDMPLCKLLLEEESS
jgi:hypothetical protein